MSSSFGATLTVAHVVVSIEEIAWHCIGMGLYTGHMIRTERGNASYYSGLEFRDLSFIMATEAVFIKGVLWQFPYTRGSNIDPQPMILIS